MRGREGKRKRERIEKERERKREREKKERQRKRSKRKSERKCPIITVASSHFPRLAMLHCFSASS